MNHVPHLWVPYDKVRKIIEEGYIKKYIKNHHLKYFKENKKIFEKMIHGKIMNEEFGGTRYEIDL